MVVLRTTLQVAQTRLLWAFLLRVLPLIALSASLACSSQVADADNSISYEAQLWHDGEKPVALSTPPIESNNAPLVSSNDAENDVEQRDEQQSDRYEEAEETLSTGIVNETVIVQAISACGNEYVELYNNTPNTVSLDGWLLRDNTARNNLRIGAYLLQPNQAVKVYTQSAPAGEPNTISIGRGQGIFNNSGGDSVRLYSPDDSLVFQIEYSGCGMMVTTDDIADDAAETITPLPPMELTETPLTVQCIHLTDEYVIIHNSGDTTVNLSDWYLEDEAGNRLMLASNFELASGAEHRFYTMDISSRASVWNNDGDTAILYEPGGALVHMTSTTCSDDATTPPDQPPPSIETQNFNLAVQCIHLTDEYVVIRNNDDVTVNLLGWYLEDESENKLTIATSVELSVDAEHRFYTAEISNRASIWNNGGDTAFLYEPSGVLIDMTSSTCSDDTRRPPGRNNTPPANPGQPAPPVETQNFNLTVQCIHLTDEYVVIRNDDGVTVNLLGWYLEDEVGNRLTITNSVELSGGTEHRFYTTEISNRAAIWNNDGDTASLYEPSGVLIHMTSVTCSGDSNPPDERDDSETGTMTVMPPEMMDDDAETQTNSPPPIETQNFNLAVQCIHLTDEYVVIRNNDNVVVNLLGWYLEDEAENRLTIANSVELSVGTEHRFYTAEISNRAAVWNNEGDTAFLYEPSGVLIHMTSVPCSDDSNPPDEQDDSETGTTTVMPPAPQQFDVEVFCIHLEEEYIIIRNNGATAVNLLGWYLEDAAGHRLMITSATELSGNGEKRFYTADISSRASIWNNDGDTAFLYTPSDMLVHTTSTTCSDIENLMDDPEPSTQMPSTLPTPETQTMDPPPNVVIATVSQCGDDEHVVLRNDGTLAVDLAGWYLRDIVDNTVKIVNSFILEPNAEVRIYTSEASGAGIVGMSNIRAVWNNTGDTAFLLSPASDAPVDEFTYTNRC